MSVSELAVLPESLAHQRADTLRWNNVFVSRRMPVFPFFQSAFAHGLVLLLVLGASRLNWASHDIPPLPENPEDHTLYIPSEYLPPLDTREALAAQQQQTPDPAYAAQAIISLPRDPDNHSQTVVTPADVKLDHPQALPNVLDWPAQTRMPIAPAPVLASEIERLDRNAPALQNAVVAPPPDVSRQNSRRLQAPEQSVIAPPPTTLRAQTRTIGDITIGHTDVIAPAPQLTLGEQRSYSGATPGRPATAVVAPPPAFSGGARSGRMVALNLQPAVGAPAPPTGNRKGSFAATPEGRPGGSGAPNGVSGGKGSGGNNSASKNGLPSGLYVGQPPPGTVGPSSPKTAPSRGTTSAEVATTANTASTKLPAAEREVFGDRRVYSITLNTPNLNSASGSWVVRFAERNPDRVLPPGAAATPTPGLSAPIAIHKVDPAYPIELMRENVGGTVVLFAVIGADGKVSNVKIIEGADDRLDLYASQALARWEFKPAIKNGTAVDVEAVFRIPFRPAKRTGF